MIQPVDVPSAMTWPESVKLAELAKDKVVLEIGSLLGHSTIVMASVAKVVHAIDPHEGYPDGAYRPTFNQFSDNLNRYGVKDRVVIHVARAQAVLPAFRLNYFDFGLIDYSLAESWPTFELMGWAQKVIKEYGILAVHDYGNRRWPGATKAVDEWTAFKGGDKGKVGSLALIEVYGRG